MAIEFALLIPLGALYALILLGPSGCDQVVVCVRTCCDLEEGVPLQIALKPAVEMPSNVEGMDVSPSSSVLLSRVYDLNSCFIW